MIDVMEDEIGAALGSEMTDEREAVLEPRRRNEMTAKREAGPAPATIREIEADRHALERREGIGVGLAYGRITEIVVGREIVVIVGRGVGLVPGPKHTSLIAVNGAARHAVRVVGIVTGIETEIEAETKTATADPGHLPAQHDRLLG
jgi:hypothetical protein